MMRAYGKIDWPAIDVWRCMNNGEFRTQWDITSDQTKYLKKVGANALYYYKKTVKKFVVAPRDFVCDFLMNQEADGSIATIASSDKCQCNYPTQSGIVRGESPISGTFVK